ncbi:unnamed protein product [Linum trigynum]|uniref:Chitin-binding type-1 domain-containing protein n=1 Tax=Linum trigynum TaxID=586398 RepID=A0AAV2E941_9ROSI
MRWLILLIATLVIAHLGLPAANHIGHERSDHRCGPSVNCSLCNKKRCCSASGYCGSGDDYCGVYSCAYDCPFDHHTPPCKPYASSFSDLAAGTGDVGGERANCAVIHVNMSMGWIQQHGPAVFCGRQPASNGRTATSSDAC